MTDRIIRKSIFLNADRQTVWSYLTDPEKLAIWFHPPKTPISQGQKLEMFGADSGDLLMWGDVITARAGIPRVYLHHQTDGRRDQHRQMDAD
jgi:uncharacterized protein YndB with AHSA1/START domain